MRESLSDLVGAPLSDWAWLKASLPSSLGGLNMRSATLHTPSAYVSSLDQSQLLMTEILDRHPAPSRHLAEAVPDLAQAAESPDWSLWKILMSPSGNVIYLARSTRPPTTPSSHQPLIPAPEPWPYHRQSPTLEIGLKWFHLQL